MKKLLFVFSILLSLSLIARDVTAQSPTPPPTVLYPGDVAIVGFNTTSTIQQIAIALLTDINTDTVIGITDRGWSNASNSFVSKSGDGVIDWKANRNYMQGEIIIVSRGSSDEFYLNPSTCDQIFLFQGNVVTSPRLLFGININHDWYEIATSNSTSQLPIINGSAIPNLVNFYFNSIANLALKRFNSSNDAMSYITNSSNWIGSNDNAQILPTVQIPIGPTNNKVIDFSTTTKSENRYVLYLILILITGFSIIYVFKSTQK